MFGVLFVEDLRLQKGLLRSQVKSKSGKVEISLKGLMKEFSFGDGALWGLYKPLGDEPDLIDLPNDELLLWPYVADEDLSEMAFSKASGFKQSELGFDEPAIAQKIPKNKISVLLIPGQAFDFKGNRLGRGKGFYDQYLKGFSGITIGVCSRERFLDEPIPVDQSFDVAVQFVLTEEFLYKVNPYGEADKK